MSQPSILHQEPFGPYLERLVQLNRLHNPDDPLHEDILAPRPQNGADAAAGPGSDARGKLATLHKEFPYGSPLPEQCAYVVRSFVGLAPFSAANLRTSWDFLAGLLQHQGHELVAPDADVGILGNDLWDRMESAYPSGFQAGNLRDRDDVLKHLSQWFKPRIAAGPQH